MACVLIVDDEALLRKMLRAELELAGYEVHEAADGVAGLEDAARLFPDVIFLDVRMPGLDGYEVCARLKANPATQRIPVIFLTAVEDEALSLRVRQVGGTACLTKPFRPTEVRALAQWFIANGRQKGGA